MTFELIFKVPEGSINDDVIQAIHEIGADLIGIGKSDYIAPYFYKEDGDLYKTVEEKVLEVLDIIPEAILVDVQRDIADLLNELTDSYRLELFSNYCTHCGSKNPRCVSNG